MYVSQTTSGDVPEAFPLPKIGTGPAAVSGCPRMPSCPAGVVASHGQLSAMNESHANS